MSPEPPKFFYWLRVSQTVAGVLRRRDRCQARRDRAILRKVQEAKVRREKEERERRRRREEERERKRRREEEARRRQYEPPPKYIYLPPVFIIPNDPGWRSRRYD